MGNTGTFASFFEDKKSHKEVTVQNRINQGFSYYFCLMIEGSGAGSGAGSVLVINGSGYGSGRPKSIRILIPNTKICLEKIIPDRYSA
jgi:hypothetical protein